MDDKTDNLDVVKIAAMLAVSFNANVEKATIVSAEVPEDGIIFPSYIESLEEKSLYELSEAPTTVDFTYINNLHMTRPLTFVEIVERLIQLGAIKV